jgi:tetratricopeptide (TPR) repeat protein
VPCWERWPKSIDALRAWETLDPNRFDVHNMLSLAYQDLGLYDKALEESQAALAAMGESTDPIGNANLGNALLLVGGYDDAAVAFDRALLDAPDSPIGHVGPYEVALLRTDQARVEQERAWFLKHTDDAPVVASLAAIELYEGRFRDAAQTTQRAVGMANESNLHGSAANALLALAKAQAVVGYSAEARKSVTAAINIDDSNDTKKDAAIILALTGDSIQPRKLTDTLVKESPSDTLLQGVGVPSSRDSRT